MINIEVAIYGQLAQVFNKKYVSQSHIEIKLGAKVKDLYSYLSISPADTTYIFINAVLCDVPGLNAAYDEPLHDGDHVGIFSTGYMWPYQYRDGAHITDRLREALKKHGAMHNTYDIE
ncbi:MAG: hypothetical protein U9Q82_11410 [Chloroflexota bacterium]|nr:hypothetical protein [Chloroflexota bacterium]